METIKLPKTLLHLATTSTCTENVTGQSYYLEKIIPYVDSALVTGRPLDTALISLAGYSGSGKSTLINVLYSDDQLCPTNNCRSETSIPTTITKPLRVTDGSQAVHGNLSFIDLPGSLDTTAVNEITNFALVRNLFETMEELTPRTSLDPSIRETVYPNLVLFVIRATDNRYVGDNTFLRKALEQLNKQGNIIDRKHPNLIVVITNALHFGLDSERFTADLTNFKENIRSIVEDILAIKEFDIVAVENDPDKYQLPKREGFYELPDGDISHHNLIQAMIKRFDKNMDKIGKLFVSWYLGQNCPEKEEAAIVTKHDAIVSPENAAIASSFLAELGRASQEPLPIFQFQLLGSGYCPVNEEVKFPSLLYNPGLMQNMKIVDIGTSYFQVPSCVSVIPENSKMGAILHNSYFTKEAYENQAKMLYELEEDMELVVNTGYNSKWIVVDGASQDKAFYSFVREIKTTSVELDMENMAASLTASPVMTEMTELPEEYTAETGPQFREFFMSWGTHIIYKEDIGGAIEVDCVSSNATTDPKTFQHVMVEVGCIFKEFLETKDAEERADLLAILQSYGIKNEQFRFEGGNHPCVGTMIDLTSEVVNDWMKSVARNPVELRHSIRLYPYYKLMGNEKRFQSLRAATMDYMKGRMRGCDLAPKKPETQSRNELSKISVDMLKKLTGTAICYVTKSILVRFLNSPQMAQSISSAVATTLSDMIFQPGDDISLNGILKKLKLL